MFKGNGSLGTNNANRVMSNLVTRDPDTNRNVYKPITLQTPTNLVATLHINRDKNDKQNSTVLSGPLKTRVFEGRAFEGEVVV